MQSRSRSFFFDTTFNFGTDSVFVEKSDDIGEPFPPVEGNFLLLDGTPFLLLDGTNLLLL
jgi:hypothetical protein